jgi:hypothetical protein
MKILCVSVIKKAGSFSFSTYQFAVKIPHELAPVEIITKPHVKFLCMIGNIKRAPLVSIH